MNNIQKIFLVGLIVFYIPLIYPQQQTDNPWPTLADSPWPMIKHDPQFTGRSPYKGPQTPNIEWTKDMPYGIFSGPVIGEDENLYFGSYYVFADYFYSYNPDGDFLWSYQTGNGRPPQSGILIDSSNTIYFGSRDSNFYALNSDGTLKWKYKTSGQIDEVSIPNIDLRGTLYITNILGELFSINPDGTLNWSIKYENGFGDNSPAFSPDGSTIYICGRDSNLFALNLDAGIKWKFSCGRIRHAPMIDSFGNIYFIPIESPQYIYSLLSDGIIRWQFLIQDIGPADIYSTPTIDYKGNLSFISYDTTCCPYYLSLISLSYDGNFRWKYIFNDEDNDDFWQPLICDSEGTVYVGSTFGNNYYAISSDGELKWKLPLMFSNQQVDNTGAISEDGTLYLGVHDVSLVINQTKTLIAIRDTGTTSVNNNFNIFIYQLEQNYPNPFNPKTIIKYSLAEPSIIRLSVYNLLGEEIELLEEGYKQEGSYEIVFNASQLPSGIYIYKLVTEQHYSSKKMILIK